MSALIAIGMRRLILSAVESGSSIRLAARRFAVIPSAAVKLIKRVWATGSAGAGPQWWLSAPAAGQC